MSGLEWMALGSLAAWTYLLLDRTRRWPEDLDLESLAAGVTPRFSEAKVLALVPARNEAECLAVTLPALLGQEGLDLKVILIDDGSVDGTVEVARLVGQRSGFADRLSVVAAPPLSVGLSGKVKALETGLAAAQLEFESNQDSLPDWILLTDADILHRPGSVRDLVDLACRNSNGGQLDLISVMARLRTDTFWERLLVPPFVFFFQILYPFRKVADESSRIAAAAGGCILVCRESLERAGGFASLLDALIDDVALAREIKRGGGRLWLGFDQGILSIRSYPRLRHLWQMISRAAFTQLHHSTALLVLTLIGLATLVISPPFVLGISLTSLLFETANDPLSFSRAALWAGLAWFLEALVLLPSVRHHRMGRGWATTLPCAGVLFGLMTLTSALRYWSGMGVQWKGRRL